MHSFENSLAFSHSASDWPGWEKLYRQFFPTAIAILDHRHDGEHQRAGIDRSIVLANTKQIFIDEKVRGRNKKTGLVYEDILLETLSDSERGVDGWVTKAVRADYIAYLIAPLGTCYLLPVIQLQIAWTKHGRVWQTEYGERPAYNHDPKTGRQWTTISVPVPIEKLFPAIGGSLRANFESFELNT